MASFWRLNIWFRSGVLFSDDDEAVIAGVMVGMSMSGKDEMREES